MLLCLPVCRAGQPCARTIPRSIAVPLPCGSKCWMCALVLVPSHDGSKYPTLDFLPGTRPSHSSGCLCLIHSCSHSLSLSLTHSSSLSLIAPRLLVVSLSFVVSLSHTHGLSHSFSRCFSYPLSLSRTRCLSPVSISSLGIPLTCFTSP